MALVDLKARLLADPSGFQAGVASAERSLNSFEARTRNSARGFGAAMNSMTAGLASFTAMLGPLAAGLTAWAAVTSLFDKAREFESAMGVIQAASGATGAALMQAEHTIRELGLATGFGAREAASAAEELLKAGLSVADLQAGALEASMTLAAATGGTMADGANIAVRAMMNFNVEAANLSDVVQGAAGVINATTFGLQDYSLALGMAGNAAASMGVSLEDFNATVALTAVAFSSGSDAGTSFKTFLQRLASPAGEARTAMEQLGFSVFDAQGRFVGMEEVARRLHDRFSGLTQEQRANAVVTIFGADAQRTANVLIDQGAEALVRMRDVTLQQADATAMAAARWQGVNGAISNLSAKWEELAIALSGSGVQKFLADAINLAGQFVGVLIEVANWLNRINGGVTVSDDREENVRQLNRQVELLEREAQAIERIQGAGDDLDARQRASLEQHRQRFEQIRANIELLRGSVFEARAPRAQAPAIDAATQAAIEAASRVAEETNAGNGTAAGRAAERAQAEAEERLARHLERMAELGADAQGEIDGAAIEQANRTREWIEEQFGRVEETLGDQLGQVADTMADSLYGALERAFVTGDWSNIEETLKRDFMQVLWDVFIGDELHQQLRQIAEALKGVFNNLFGNLFNGMGGGGAGGGGWLSSIFNAIGGLFGRRAVGGPVSSPVIVGEHGPELFDPHGGSGNIVPLTTSAHATGGGLNVTYAPVIDARGVDAAQVARLEAQQMALIENLETLVVGYVNENHHRRKIG